MEELNMGDRWICSSRSIKIIDVFASIFYYTVIYNKTIHFYLENKHFRNRIWVYEALIILWYNDIRKLKFYL